MNEPQITINGTTLTDAQAMTLRVALSLFLTDMRADGLGGDELGREIAKGYLTRGGEILHIMLRPR